ncbi:MAG: hypothetical protein VB095_08760 [Anaerovorax sp.]|nr:hypothetical protein [Anaerovorax sp.]
MTDWIMIAITAIYVIATIAIWASNNKSAKATEKQVLLLHEQLEQYKQNEKNEAIKRQLLIGSIKLRRSTQSRTASDYKKYLAENDITLTEEEVFNLCIELHAEEKMVLINSSLDKDIKKWEFGKVAIKNANE